MISGTLAMDHVDPSTVAIPLNAVVDHEIASAPVPPATVPLKAIVAAVVLDTVEFTAIVNAVGIGVGAGVGVGGGAGGVTGADVCAAYMV